MESIPFPSMIFPEGVTTKRSTSFRSIFEDPPKCEGASNQHRVT